MTADFRRRALLITVSGLAVASLASAAAAQTTGPNGANVSVRERPRPGYDALGVRAGAFLVYPRLETGVAWTDNALATSSNEESDVIVTVRPSVVARSQWSRHQLDVFAEATRAEYQDNDQESRTEWGVGARGRLDVRRDAQADLRVERWRRVLPRSDASTPSDAIEPVKIDLALADAGAAVRGARFGVRGDLRWRRFEHEDVRSRFGPLISQSYRDRDVTEQQVRVDYRAGPSVAVYGTVQANQRRHDRIGPGGVNRDSQGWEVGVGADFDLTRLARGQVQVGYLTQDYEDPSAGETSGLAVRSRVEWYPTQLTTVTVEVERAVADSGVETAAGLLTTRAGVRVDHELRRNVLLWGRAEAARDEYRGADRDDDLYEVGFGADLKVNRNVAVRVGVERFDRSSSGAAPGFDFTENRAGLALVLQL